MTRAPSPWRPGRVIRERPSTRSRHPTKGSREGALRRATPRSDALTALAAHKRIDTPNLTRIASATPLLIVALWDQKPRVYEGRNRPILDTVEKSNFANWRSLVTVVKPDGPTRPKCRGFGDLSISGPETSCLRGSKPSIFDIVEKWNIAKWRSHVTVVTPDGPTRPKCRGFVDSWCRRSGRPPKIDVQVCNGMRFRVIDRSKINEFECIRDPEGRPHFPQSNRVEID